jgi:adenylate kinase family enzyme
VHRIAVIGNAGSGKTTLARELARRLGSRYIDFDATVLRPRWDRVPRDERMALFEPLTPDGDWTIDGHLWTIDEHLRSNREWEHLVLQLVDTVIWLDLPLWRVMVSVTVRTLRNMTTRRHAFGGNIETFFSILFSPNHSMGFAWTMHDSMQREFARMFSDPANRGKTLLRFRSRRDVQRWLRTVGVD